MQLELLPGFSFYVGWTAEQLAYCGNVRDLMKECNKDALEWATDPTSSKKAPLQALFAMKMSEAAV